MSRPERSANFNKVYELTFYESERERFTIDLTYVTSYPAEDTSLYVNISKWWKDTLGDNLWHPTKKHLYIPAVAFNNLVKSDSFNELVAEFNQEFNGASNDTKPEEKANGVGKQRPQQQQQRQQLAGRGRRGGGYNNAANTTSSSSSNASSVAVKRNASTQETTPAKKRRGPPQKKATVSVKQQQHRAATPDDCDGSDNGGDDEERDGGDDDDDVMRVEQGNNGVASA